MAKNDRRRHEPRHIRVYHSMMDTPAWLDLSGNAVKLLLKLSALNNGRNNGEIFLSCRNAAEQIGVGKKCAVRLFHELEEHGFIEATERGYFSVKQGPATSWRLTWQPTYSGRAPTNDYRNWSKKDGGQNDSHMGVKMTPISTKPAAMGVKMTPRDNANPPFSKTAHGCQKGYTNNVPVGDGVSCISDSGETPAGELRDLPFKLVPIAEIVGDLARRMALAEAA